jgi:hypothetical protein
MDARLFSRSQIGPINDSSCFLEVAIHCIPFSVLRSSALSIMCCLQFRSSGPLHNMRRFNCLGSSCHGPQSAGNDMLIQTQAINNRYLVALFEYDREFANSSWMYRTQDSISNSNLFSFATSQTTSMLYYSRSGQPHPLPTPPPSPMQGRVGVGALELASEESSWSVPLGLA